ncbi:tetratricopeptide repeat protein [Streptomyces sp. NPDC058964]|uniref:tetratricopeptide repeat protein n=1 Tax=Streptomyces sp. NPDC058964 TaxID=3346681 RepID=UPI0036C8EEE4
MPDTAGVDSLEALRQAIATRTAVVIIDSDASHALSGGCPEAAWPDLLRSLVDWCEEHVAELPGSWAEHARAALRWGAEGELSAYRLVTERLTDQLGGRDGDAYGTCLRATLGALPLAHAEPATALQDLRIPILSVAQDDLVERALGLHGPAVTWRDPYLVRHAMESEDTALIHLYGRWDSPSSVLFGVQEPERLLGKAAETLRRLIVGDRSLVFIGSGADPALRVVRDWLLEGAPGMVGRHYWLCPEHVGDQARAETAGTAVTPVVYHEGESASGRTESGLVRLLRRLTPPAGVPGLDSSTADNVAAEPRPIIGREALLDEIGAALAPASHAPSILVLRGAMGVGKTRLAREFVLRSRQGDDSVRWWVPAEHVSGAEQAYAGLASQLGLAVINDIARTCQAVRARLEAMEDWMLVFDNVESIESIQHLIPAGGSGRVLLTTRLSQDEIAGQYTTVTVPPLAVPDAITLLCAKDEWQDQDSTADRRPGGDAPGAGAVWVDEAIEVLCRELDCLPQQLIPAREELARGTSPRRLLAELRRRHAGHSEAASYAIAVDRLSAISSDALDLLRLCSYLGPGPFDLRLLTDLAGRTVLPEGLRTALRDSGRVGELVRHIVSTGLADEIEGRFELHRLVQHYVRTQEPDAGGVDWHDIAVTFLLAIFPADPANPESWPRCADLLEHALSVGGARLSGTRPGPHQVELLNRCGIYLFGRGAYASSAAIFRRAAAMLRSLFGQGADYAAALSNLGLSRLNQGHLERSRRLQERALDIRTTVQAAVGELAASYNNLGCALRELGDLHGAERALREGLALAEGGDRLEVRATRSKILNNLGVIRMQLRLPDSLDFFEQALTQENALPGDRRLDVAITTNNLGIAHTSRGEYREAERALGEALLRFKQVLPDDHPDFGSLYNNLGLTLRGQGRAAESLPYFERALDIERRFLGEQHPEVAGTLINIGVTLRHLHRYAAAYLHQEEALGIFEAAYGGGSEHRLLASTHGALGNMLRRLGDVPGAIEHHRRALEIESLAYPPGDYELAGTHDNLGRALRHMGAIDEAVDHFRQALDIKRRHLPDDAVETAKTWDNLGVAYRFQGETAKAVHAHEQALCIRRRHSLEGDDRQLHYSLVAYAMACRQLGLHDQAERALREAADMEALW